MSEIKRIISNPIYTCPNCGEVWYENDLENLNSVGCPSCAHKFNLEEWLHEDEILYTNWREICYFRMMKQKKLADETEKFMRFNDKLRDAAESELFNQILNDHRSEK